MRLASSAVLPPPGPLRRYAAVTFVDSVGSGLFLTVSVLFFTKSDHLSVAEVGTGMSVAGGAAFLGAIPLGALGDRVGPRRLWVVLTFVQCAALAAYPLVRSFGAFAAVVGVAALAEVGVSPVRGAYLAAVAGPETRVRARAYNQAVANAGFALGAAGAGAALQLGTHRGYMGLVLADSASYLAVGLVLLTLPAAGPHRRRSRAGAVLRDRTYLLVCLLNGLLMTYAAVLTVALPLWIVDRTDAPAWSVGAVMVLNTVLVVAFQVRAGRGAETVPGAAATVRRAGVALLVSCLLFAVSGLGGRTVSLLVLAAGAAALTAAELLHAAAAWGLSYGLAPEDQQARYLGAFSMGSRIYDTLGPALVTALALGLGPPGWLLLGALFLGLSLALSGVSLRACRAKGRHRAPDGNSACANGGSEPGGRPGGATVGVSPVRGEVGVVLVEALAVLAAAGGTAVVQAAGTDAWAGLRQRVARLLGRGDEAREHAELARLDQTAATLAAVDGSQAQQVHARQEAAWQTRFELFLEGLDDAGRDQAAAELRALLAEFAIPAGSGPSAPGGVAAAGNVTIRADNGSVAAGVIHGNVSTGNPSRPDPSRG
jgi:Major Facilitator Superfamily